MSTPWFFLSYSRTGDPDIDRHAREFYERLVGEMRNLRGELKGRPAREIGFMDVKTIDTGDDWRRVLFEELWNCRVLVCLYSDGFFTSENCGKEFYAFRSRFDAGGGEKLLQSVLPVLWSRPDSLPRLPSAVEGMQYKDDALDAVSGAYARKGLYAIKSQGAAAEGEYISLVQEFAARIIKMADESPPPALGRPPRSYKPWNAWVDPPPAPSLLEAELIAPRQIRLSWDENPASPEGEPPESAGSKGFYVERLRHGGRPGFVLLKELKHDSFSYTDSRKVAPGTAYRYRVCAFNAGGPSDYAESDDVKTKGQQPPPMPSDFTATPSWTFQVRLAWVDNSGGKGFFKIERCNGAAGGNFKQVAQVGPGVTAHKDLVLRPSFTYVYRVCASDGEGDSDYTDEVKVSTLKPLLLTLLVLAAVVAAAAVKFRCDIAPSLCTPTTTATGKPEITPETPTPTPTPFVDLFEPAGDGGPAEKKWSAADNWLVPEQWSRWEGESFGQIVLKGTQPGAVKNMKFGDSVIRFGVMFVRGDRAGWMVRAAADDKGVRGGYCFVLEKRPAGRPFKFLAYDCASGAKIKTDTDEIGITQYGKMAEDFIQVEAVLEKNEFTFYLSLKNYEEDKSRPESRGNLDQCYKARVTVEPDAYREGSVGLFAVGSDTEVRISTFEVYPLKEDYIDVVQCLKK